MADETKNCGVMIKIFFFMILRHDIIRRISFCKSN